VAGTSVWEMSQNIAWNAKKCGKLPIVNNRVLRPKNGSQQAYILKKQQSTNY